MGLDENILEEVHGKQPISLADLATSLKKKPSSIMGRLDKLVKSRNLKVNADGEFLPGEVEALPMMKCPICGKAFKNKSGLNGHIHFAHKPSSESNSEGEQVNEEAKTPKAQKTAAVKTQVKKAPVKIQPVEVEELDAEEFVSEPMETQESLGVSEYEQFKIRGLKIGIGEQLVEVTTDHVFNGGNFRDLNWIWEALSEMNIRTDLKERWFHSWSSYLGQKSPEGVRSQIAEAHQDEGAKNQKSERSYILSSRGIPKFVGEGNGDLTYEDAVQLAKLQTAREEGEGKGDSAIEMLRVFKEITGAGSDSKEPQRPVMIVPQPDGSFAVKEVKAGEPIAIPAPAAKEVAQGKSYIIDGDTVREVPPGAPVIIKKDQEAPVSQPQPARTMLIDKATGEVREVDSRQPIVIIQSPPAQVQAPAAQPIMLQDRDGKPIT
ncbi:MAG: C2H2-type zinc finger protein, partial [Methylobacter sp.]|nr:C2H2-type zinc finger protein [Methylobacter sp.]